MPKIGYCRYCRRNDAEVYDQKAEVHNAECKECWALYSAIRDYPGRIKGNCRAAFRLALEEIKRPETFAKPSEPVDECGMTQDDSAGLAKIRERLKGHPSRAGGFVETAIRVILREIAGHVG